METRLLLALGMCFLAACGDEDKGGTAADTAALKGCFFDFSADVRSGPNAGLKLEGELMVMERPAGGNAVAFVQKDQTEEEPLIVDATFAGGQVTLRFPLAQGTIVGTGPMDADLSTCPDDLAGDLTGPAEGDTGDWIGSFCIYNFDLCVAAVSFVGRSTCFAGCSYAGYTDAACNQTCGTNN